MATSDDMRRLASWAVLSAVALVLLASMIVAVQLVGVLFVAAAAVAAPACGDSDSETLDLLPRDSEPTEKEILR